MLPQNKLWRARAKLIIKAAIKLALLLDSASAKETLIIVIWKVLGSVVDKNLSDALGVLVSVMAIS